MGERVSNPASVSEGRIHGLDALRGILMMLGIVLHSSHGDWFRYGSESTQFFIRTNSHVIHLFRMPAFFLLSGFFCALLWHKRGARKTFRNRFDRLAVPLFGWLWVAFPALCLLACIAMFGFGDVPNAWDKTWEVLVDEVYLQDNLHHLWFLYYLILVTIIVTTVVVWLERVEVDYSRTKTFLKRTFERPLRCVFIFGLFNALYWIMLGWGHIPTSSTWSVNLEILTYYTLYFSLGWCLFTAKADIHSSQKLAWTLLALAVLILAVCSIFQPTIEAAIKAKKPTLEQTWIYSLYAVTIGIVILCFIRGLMGLFIRYASSGRFVWRYISDASYWVYLFHLLLTLMFPELLRSWDAPIIIKYLVTIVATFIGCVVTYDLFVRSTWIGRMLNGRRYDRAIPKFSMVSTLVILGFVGWSVSLLIEQDKRTRSWYQTSGPMALIPFDYDSRFGPKAKTIKGTSLRRCLPLGRHTFCPVYVGINDASAICTHFGQTIATPKTKDQNKLLKEVMLHVSPAGFWIDANDKNQEGVWTWRGGEKLSYTHWFPGEPNDYGGKEDCAMARFASKKDSGWNDVSCESKLAVVCEEIVAPQRKTPQP